MATPLATAFVEIRPYTKAFGKQLKGQLDADGAAAAEKSGASAGESYMSGLGSKVKNLAGKITAGLFAAGGAMAVAGIDMASKFNSEMELLATQAGVAQPKVAALSDGVLKLAGQVGFSPDSLAESLFHVESNFASLGIKGPQALHLVKIAAEGAAVGHADLVDVTNALTAAVASGIPGVENFGKAMGSLNTIVGSGDMKMQDLADAFGTGLLASVKGFGLSLNDVGAALATFGDNNIRGAKAGTELRMAVQALAAPTAQGAKSLIAMGISSGSLAKAMGKGGLKLALETLISHMKKAGITATQEGQVLTNVFGKKAGVGIQILTGQMNRFLSKYPALEAGAGKFGKAWSRTQETTAQKLKDLQAGFAALEIRIGEKLLPVVMKLFNWIQSHTRLVAILAGTIAGLAVSISMVTRLYGAIEGVAKAFGFLKDQTLAMAVATRVAAAAGAIYDGVLAASATAMVAFQDSAVAAKIAILAQAVATRVAAAAQFLFDAAMDANPVGLVVIAVVALIAGLYELFKHVTIVRTIFEAVFNWIKDHWKLLAVILLGPFGVVIDVIATYWHQIIHGVAGVISWIAGHWKLLLVIFTGPIGLVVDIIVTQWHHIAHAFEWLWGYIWRDFGAKILNFFTHTVPHWFDAFVNLAKARWNDFKQALAELWRFVWTDFGQKIFNFYTHTIPQWLATAANFLVTNFVDPEKQAFSQLWQWIWTDFGQKIFGFLTKTIPQWFGDAVHAIGRAWTAIENAVKIPVNWVIQYVYDDGIRKVWNFVANLAGLPDLPVIATLAEGGRIPGFGGGDRHPALLEGGEAVIDKHRTKALAPLFSAIGVPGFSKGGIAGDRGMSGTPQAAHASSLLGGIGDTFRIMAALATGNKVALDHAFEDLFPSASGSGAKPGSGIFRAITELPLVMVTDLVAKAIKAFAAAGGGIIAFAESFIGKVPYKWGGTTTAGWDCCIIGSMRVQTNLGPKEIRDIRAGDVVYSWNDGKLAASRVLRRSAPRHQQTYRLRTIHREIVASGNHPFLTLRKGVPVPAQARLAVSAEKLGRPPGQHAHPVSNERIRNLYLDGYSLSEVAAHFGISVGTVQRRLDLTGTPRRLRGASGRGGRRPASWSAEWVNLEDLRRGDIIVALRNLPDQAPAPVCPLLADKRFLWLLGLAFGDGTLSAHRANRVDLCVFGDLRDEVQDRLADFCGKRGSETDKHGIYLFSEPLAAGFRRFGMDARSTERVLPRELWSLPHGHIQAFLDGYTAADGHRVNRVSDPALSYKAANRRLVEDVRNLHMILGHNVTRVRELKRTRPIVIRGVEVKNARSLWTFEAYETGAKTLNAAADILGNPGVAAFFPADSHFIPQKVTAIEPMEVEDTYDIAVEDTHNFVAEGLVVHNSGFTQFVYDHFGYSPPRTAAEQQAWAQKTGSPVPGGLAFFAGADGTAASAGHVGIIVGPNQMVDAFGTGFGTRLDTLYGSSGASGGFGIPPGGFGHHDGLVARHFDQGGWLPPGLSLTYNGTGRPERVLGPQDDIGGRLDVLISLMAEAVTALRGAPGETAAAFGGVLGNSGRRAAYRAMYSAR